VKGETVIPKKVLIIDDEVLIRKTTALLLKKARIDVITAGNGPEGIDLAEKQNPDLILLDIVMPEMSGWEVLSRLKAREDLAKIPVIVFTAEDYSMSEGKAMQKGAEGVCRKPFQLHQLLGIIDGLNKESSHVF
jgi:CheY-like chemotaxis protein